MVQYYEYCMNYVKHRSFSEKQKNPGKLMYKCNAKRFGFGIDEETQPSDNQNTADR